MDVCSLLRSLTTDHEVTELTWENGQLSMHGLSNNMISSPAAPNKNTTACGGPDDHTLESIVHQATCHQKHNLLNMMMMTPQSRKPEHSQPIACVNTGTTTGGAEEAVAAGQVQMLGSDYNLAKKRTRSETESDQCWRYLGSSSSSRVMHDLGAERSACASANATFCREKNNSNSNKDTTMMTWGASSSFESPPPSMKSIKTNHEDDSAASHGGGSLENRDEEKETTRGGTARTCSARRNRAAAIHNQSERRRRDRINQKMKALQKLVPNASKTDKASMLDEVIEYLKQLQAQVNLMSTTTATSMMPQMMMMNPLAIQQQLQMSTLLAAARMGISGNGLGIPTPNPHHNHLQSLMMNSSTTTPTPLAPPFLPAPPPVPFVVPPVIPPVPAAASNATTTSAAMPNRSASGPLNNPYNAFLAQQRADHNMDFYGKIAAMYRQQQANQTRSNPIMPNFNPGK